MKIDISKDIIRNNGYNLTAFDLSLYLKLLFISKHIDNYEIHLDTKNFRDSIMVADNRTLKKSLNNLYNNELIKDTHTKLPTKGALKIRLSKAPFSSDTISVDKTVLDSLPNVNHIGIHIILYLLSYKDISGNDYSKLVEYETMGKRLMLNKDTIVVYMKKIKRDGCFSYLVDNSRFNYKGNSIYKEDYIYPKRISYNRENLELKLEDALVSNLELIEEGMTFVDRQAMIKEGRVDIVARDKNNTLCIIELKVTPNDEKIVFQSVYYPTQFEEPTRMITIAPDYDYKIKISLDALGVERKLYRYENNTLIISNCS